MLFEHLCAPQKNDIFYIFQDCHGRAWDAVRAFMSDHLVTFSGKTTDAESTVMPAVRSWLRESSNEVGNAADDHSIVLFCVCPAMGILSASRMGFLLNFITNVLSDFPANSICILVKPNRAGQQDGRTGLLYYQWF